MSACSLRAALPGRTSLKEKRHYVRSARHSCRTASARPRRGRPPRPLAAHQDHRCCVRREHHEPERCSTMPSAGCAGRSGRSCCVRFVAIRRIDGALDDRAVLHEQDHADGARSILGQASREREPRSAPGNEPAAPTQRSVQSIPARQMPYEAAAPTAMPKTRFVPDRASRLLADPADERRSRSDPRISPTRPPRKPITAPAATAAPRAFVIAWDGRPARPWDAGDRGEAGAPSRSRAQRIRWNLACARRRGMLPATDGGSIQARGPVDAPRDMAQRGSRRARPEIAISPLPARPVLELAKRTGRRMCRGRGPRGLRPARTRKHTDDRRQEKAVHSLAYPP